MLEEQKEIDVYGSQRYGQALSNLSDTQVKILDDELDKVIINIKVGELKKGALSHLRVHKFSLNGQLALLGYSLTENGIEMRSFTISKAINLN